MRCPALRLPLLVIGAMLLPAAGATQADDVDFARDVRPILSSYCFKCHGPDDQQRQGGLRLDDRESATRPADSGSAAIVPARPEASELVRRIDSEDEGDVMPPADTKHPLTAEQKEVLRRWIAAGAVYQAHWAFQPIARPVLPATGPSDWPRNAIDYFVLARLASAGLQPSPAAEPYTLVRRVYLDLLGVPPSPAEADRFVTDPAPDAYEQLVDRLLASPQYGERWARRWLDLARYADTNGYEKDRPRSMWPYRDWVIHALNADMPFDEFTIQQLAGDMLPGAGISAQIATGFHRNTMINEEGGIDPLEFRYHAMVDRVNTTGTTWLGLTIACANCHSHKYDPISQREYYQVMAFLNNADEPVLDVSQADLVGRRQDLAAAIQAREADLASQFPPAGTLHWETVRPTSVTAASAATSEILSDGSVRWSGESPDRDTYTLTFDVPPRRVTAVRVEAVADPALPSQGPGRTPHGNFVLSELTASVGGEGTVEQKLTWATAEADFSQEGFPALHAIDGNLKTGWAIHGPGEWNVTRAIVVRLPAPLELTAATRWTLQLEQQHGSQHTLGRVRISLGAEDPDDRSLEERRREHLEQRFAAWIETEKPQARNWTPLRPVAARSNLPRLEILDDGSVLASGDQSKRDLYEVRLAGDLRGATALRLEAMADERLPRGGPGRVYYEGPFGDFFLSEITARAGDMPVAFSAAAHSFANGGNGAPSAIDGDPQTGWTIDGGQARTHTAIFQFAEPLAADELDVGLLFERYYAAGLGRFRLSVTKDAGMPAARGLPSLVEDLLTKSVPQWSGDERAEVLRHFLAVCPELAGARAAIDELRRQMPVFPTTLVMRERPADYPRPTFVHRRGEFLRPTEPVTAHVPDFLPPLPDGAPANRLGFAQWLVDARNPLTARVTVNRHWAAFFGRGIVRTTEDFGFQGELPSHPELLDWLAIELIHRGWSLKHLNRLIVTSATYRQSSSVRPELLERDPNNVLLGRGPKSRLEGELLRDTVLQISGLLTLKTGGPSVFPPQPAGITSEGTYGPLTWTVSVGEDRYRRGLYTFAKRTAPYAMFATFDAPSGEACVPRRDVTNTPLQALTLLNDEVFFEAAQALGRLAATHDANSVEDRIVFVFRRCVTRPPTHDETQLLVQFYQQQVKRLEAKELAAAAIAGAPADAPDLRERAAWTLVARALLNLDEAVCKP